MKDKGKERKKRAAFLLALLLIISSTDLSGFNAYAKEITVQTESADTTAPHISQVTATQEDTTADITVTATDTGSGMDTYYLVYGKY